MSACGYQEAILTICRGPVWVASLVLLVACLGDATGFNEGVGGEGATTEPSIPKVTEQLAGNPRFVAGDCPMPSIGGTDLSCGYLVVPEDRTNPDTQYIELAVAVLHVTDNPLPDPVVYLAGGPGSSALNELEADPDIWITLAQNIQRDLIFIDQRGAGYSYPSLNCPELEQDFTDELTATRECHDRLVAEGVDLSAYHSAASAADVEALRRALGHEQWNVLGVSYGTRLALTLMRDYPSGIRAAILDSTYPPDVDSALEEASNLLDGLRGIFATCAADPQCRSAYPDLEGTLARTVIALSETPTLIQIEDPETGEVKKHELDGDDFLNGIVQLMYDTESIPAIPRLIYEVAAGEYENYSRLVADRGFSHARFQDGDVSDSEGMNYSVQCHEEFAFTDPAEAEEHALLTVPAVFQPSFFGNVSITFEVCEWWGAGNADLIENEPVHSDIPTLILAGGFDPVTPPRWGERAAATLDNAYFYVFPAAGHAILDDSLCVLDLMRAFLADPNAEPDGACIDDLPAVDFILPGDTISLSDGY